MTRAAWVLLALLWGSSALAQPPVDVAPKSAVQKARPAAKAKPPARLAWAELTGEQQMILAPLKPEWESLDQDRRRKWIAMAKRYPKMTPKGQERVQRRMQAWAKLTPEQRRQARESYKRIAKAPPAERRKLRKQWAEYQQLPPQERERLTSEPRPRR